MNKKYKVIKVVYVLFEDGSKHLLDVSRAYKTRARYFTKWLKELLDSHPNIRSRPIAVHEEYEVMEE